jgi:Formamidopyrimidine-DNA glycosylase
MLEIPESKTIAGQIIRVLSGRTITYARANASPHKLAFYFGEPEAYGQRLQGRTISGAEALGGMVQITAGDARILLGDGANVRYFAPGAPLPERHQLHVALDDGSALVCTVQMYGGIWAYPEGQNDNPYYIAARDKPSPLTDDFGEEYFEGLIAASKPSLSLKALLAAEQRIPGLGNGVLQDILLAARENPRTKVSALPDGGIEALFKSVKWTLAGMAAGGGRDTEKDLFGRGGGYRTRLCAKTASGPCPACGGPITREPYMGGNVYFCPACQPVR